MYMTIPVKGFALPGAERNMQMKIKSIENIGSADVYNMEVDGHHNFAVNGGIIVHNCDALRYFCVMRHRPTDPIIEKKRDLFHEFYGMADDDKEGEPSDSYIYMNVRGRG